MVIMHLDEIVRVLNPSPGHPIDWANVLSRMKSLFFVVTYPIFAGAVLFHGLYGLRNILFELGIGRGLKSALNVVLVLGGVGLFAFGAWAAWAAGTLARSL